MTVRVWFRPSELGECGYHQDFEADDWRRLKDGSLHLTRDVDDLEHVVGRIQADRWDAVLILEDEAG